MKTSLSAMLFAFFIVMPTAVLAQPESVRTFLTTTCIACHDGDDAERGFDIGGLAFELDDPANFRQWVQMLDRVSADEMPPAEEEQPTEAHQAKFVDELRRTLLAANRKRYADSGRTTIRRLNRYEYERTVQDLLAISTPLAHLLPEDTPLHGFDTVSDGLRFSALHIEKYLSTADVAIQAALRLTERPEPVDKRFLYAEQEGILKNIAKDHAVVRKLDNGAVLFSDASYISKVHGLRIRTGGMYRIRVRAQAFQSDKPVVLRLHAGDYSSGIVRLLGFFDVPADKPREVEVLARLEYNEYLYPAPDDLIVGEDNKNVYGVGAERYSGSGLLVEWLEIEGPIFSQWPPVSISKVFGETPIVKRKRPLWTNNEHVAYEPQPADPNAALEALMSDFAVRAFRRPLKPGEAERFVALAQKTMDEGRTFEEAIRVGLRAILTSPQFLILDESPGPLDDYALASRMSYFLWGTMPDQPLLDLAAKGRISSPQVLRQQTERLLNDPRASAFVTSFVGQWLDLRSIDNTSPDRRLYPEFDEILKQSMIAESESFIAELLKRDLPVANVIDSDFCMVNRRLAEHYGIDGVQGQQMQRVSLPSDSVRGGVMTQGAILKVTANGTVTSPVTRGSWVLTRLFNEPPAPPPPAVGSIEPDTRGATTIREQLALHRNDPTCSSCHASIDPPGFALESFDVIGGWRDRYRSQELGERPTKKLHGRGIWEYKLGPAVDAGGVLATGESFADVQEFKRLLMKRKEDVARSVASNLLIYATGHEIELADREHLDQVLANTANTGHGLRSLVYEVVQSDLFRSK